MNITYQNLWNAAVAKLNRKFIAVNMYIKKEKKISNQHPNFTPQETRITKNKT